VVSRLASIRVKARESELVGITHLVAKRVGLGTKQDATDIGMLQCELEHVERLEDVRSGETGVVHLAVFPVRGFSVEGECSRCTEYQRVAWVAGDHLRLVDPRATRLLVIIE